MNLHKKNLRIVFLVCLVLTLLIPALLPKWRLYFFAPYLITLLYKRPLIQCLWGALFCGLLIDILSANHHLGLHALGNTIAIALLYRQKRHFFADSPSTLPIMVFLYSVSTTVVQVILRFIFEQKIPINGEWLLSEIIAMPLFDAIYAFAFYILPSMIFGKRRMKGDDYFTS